MWLKIIGAYFAWVIFGIFFRYVLDEITYDPSKCPSCRASVTPGVRVCPICSTLLGKHKRGLFS
jgi:hypothetical protein